MDGADPAMMEKLMAALGQQGGEGGEGGGMDIASMMAGMGGMGGMGMGGGPEQQQQQAAQRNQADAAAKNAGEEEGGADGKKYKCVAEHPFEPVLAPHTTAPHHRRPTTSLLRRYEQTSKYGESEIIVRFTLETPATKKDVKVVFKATTLSVTVNGVLPPTCAPAHRPHAPLQCGGLVSGEGAAKAARPNAHPHLHLNQERRCSTASSTEES